METNENEAWYPVHGYEGLYEINQQGKVKSLKKLNYGYIMKQRPDRAGYNTVRLTKPSLLSSTQYVHRLLGFAFIENPFQKPMINHIDGNKLNNSIQNLEWVTNSENMKHAYSIGLCKSGTKQTPVIDICLDKTFPSIKKAAEFYGINYATCKNYLNGNRTNTTCLRYLHTQSVA